MIDHTIKIPMAYSDPLNLLYPDTQVHQKGVVDELFMSTIPEVDLSFGDESVKKKSLHGAYIDKMVTKRDNVAVKKFLNDLKVTNSWKKFSSKWEN